jgi:hypothetical protein
MADSTDERAKEFQKACKDKGVPLEALRKVDYVGATRVVGQGSAFMRKQAVDSIGQIVGSLPEDGRQNWIDDKISAEAGQAAVLRYNPKKAQKTGMQDEQQADAMLWVSAFKNSTPFVPTSEQNPVTYAATFINAASQSLNSLQQGGDPHQVLAFLNTCGPAIALCLSRFGQDATRQSVHDEMLKQWKQIASATDKLSKAMQAQAKQQQEQQKKTQDVLSDIQLKNVQTKAAIQDKQIKIRAQLQQSQEKHRLKMAQGVQSLQLKDATTATDIKLSRLKATSTKAKGSE